MTNNRPLIGILAATAVYTIYGLNVVFCKDITSSELVSPTVLFTIRTGGAALLFWILSLFMPQEKMELRELVLAFVASALCIIIPQYSTLIGITMSTPYDASLVATLKPVLTLSVAFILGKERLSLPLVLGVLLTFAGALTLVAKPFDGETGFTTSPAGFVVLLMNGVAMAFYLVLFRDFISRHKTVTLMKWMFLFAFLVSLVVSGPQLPETKFAAFSPLIINEILFLVLFATFISYFLMPIGQRNLSSTQYSLFCYVQCIVAAIVGSIMGLEDLDGQKLLASVLFIAGVAVIRKA